ncbi:MAG: hypothetical protein H6730_08045 [Deltaproteobacteria bacterium]|nr:hypothetical protein [Deltaproteobacteria bacterium]
MELVTPPVDDELRALRRAARRRIAAYLAVAAAVAVAAYASRSSLYNGLYGPFELTAGELASAQALADLGLKRWFVVRGDTYESSGWAQYQWVEESFSRSRVDSDLPREFYIVHLGGQILAVESARAPEDATFTGFLHQTPPRLQALLEQGGGGAEVPRFFLQERDGAERGWMLEWGGGVALFLFLLVLAARELRALRALTQVDLLALAQTGAPRSRPTAVPRPPPSP